MPPEPDDSTIARPLRAWLAVEVAFGLAAMSTISLAPQDSATNFAWPIQPTVGAALLGAFYLSSAWVFVLAVLARSWERIRVMMVPAIVFTATELVTTLLHWDKFSVGTTPFAVWFASYLLPPPILTACLLWQRRREVVSPPVDPLHPRLRQAMGAIGSAIVGSAVVTFVWPSVGVRVAPFTLTPLTTRAVCGWLLALGLMLVLGARDGDRRRLLVVAPFFTLLGPAVLLQLLRFADEVDWSHPTVVVAAMVLVGVGGCGVHIALGGDPAGMFRATRVSATAR